MDRNAPQWAIRAAQPSDYPAVLEWAAGQARAAGAMRVLATTLAHDPLHRPEHLRLAFGTDSGADELVALVLVIPRPLHYGSAQLHGAIMLPIAPLDDQGQMACAALIRATLEWAKSSGLHVSLLWDGLWLLPRYGYTAPLKHYTVVLPADLPRPGRGVLTLQPALPEDAAGLQRCYTEATKTTSFATLRSAAAWEWRLADAAERIEVVVDVVRTVRGYARWRVDDVLHVHEIAVLDDGAAMAITDRLLEVAGHRSVVVTAGWEQRWSRWAWHQGASLTLRSAQQQALVRIVDVVTVCTAILPELTRRIAESEFGARHGQVRLETPIGNVGLRVTHGKVTVDAESRAPMVALPFPALNALLFGLEPINELLEAPGVYVEDAATTRLLAVLFPEGNAQWYPPPYFGSGQ